MYLNKAHNKLQAGALYYAIFVVFVLSALTSLFILHRGMQQRQMRQELLYFQAIDNINSALTIYLSKPEKYQNVNDVAIELFDDTTRRVKINREAYGLLDHIIASCNYEGKALYKSLTAGKNPFRSDSLALFVPEKKQALFASGNSRIVGNAALPAKGIQRASIEGKPLKSNTAITGSIRRSSSALPSLAPRIKKKINELQQADSLMKLASPVNELYSSSLLLSPDHETHWYGSADNYQISGIEVSGAVGFVSGGTILIRQDAVLKGVLISATRIIVEDGFQGEVQLFARDSLVIGEHCRLEYPSVVCVNNDDVSNVYASIGKQSSIEGSVIIRQEGLAVKEPLLKLCQGSSVTGQIYHQGVIELQGEIYGSLYCEGFYLKTRRAYYENHLLDNIIDFSKLPAHFVSIDLIQGYDDQVMEILGSNF